MCEDQQGGVTVGDHHATHTLVRCLEPPADEDSDEEEEGEEGEKKSKVGDAEEDEEDDRCVVGRWK